VFLFGEPFSKTQVLAFGCIWAALAIYAADGWLRWRSRPAPLASDAARVTQASN
jgi:chloramphenicol-sensitive protein RarD